MMFYNLTEGEVIWLDTRKRETFWMRSAVYDSIWSILYCYLLLLCSLFILFRVFAVEGHLNKERVSAVYLQNRNGSDAIFAQ